MSFCTRCGRPGSGTTQFCTSCGAPFPAAADAAAESGPPSQAAEYGPPSQAAEYGPPTVTAAVPSFRPRQPGGGFPAQQDSTDDPFAGLFEKAGSGRPPYTEPDQPYQGRPGPGRTKIIAIAAAIIVVLAGGVAAWAVMRHTGQPSARASHPAQVHGATKAPSVPAQSPSTSVVPTPTQTVSGLVSVAPGVSQQGNAPTVVTFLNNYFTAINHHDYQQYRSLLDAQLQQRETAAKFQAGFGSSSDSAATLTGLAAAGAQTAATVTFTSHQPAAGSPSHSSCTNWSITLYLSPQGGSYVIGTPPSSYHASYQAC
jgi:hypothetical protein